MAVYHQVVAVAVALIVVGIGSVNPAYAGEFTGYDVGIMIDAGSTGSRVHIFKWPTRTFDTIPPPLSEPVTQHSWSQRKAPGISKGQPGLLILEELIEFAKNMLAEEESRWSSFPIFLKATAGMRILPTSEVESIMASVRNYLSTTPFKFQDKWARVISGEEEGVFGWITVNYLASTLVPQGGTTLGALDLGGASTQITFVAGVDILANLFNIQLGSVVNENVYTHSFLYYGQNEAAVQVKNLVLNGKSVGANTYNHPCLPPGYSTTFAASATRNVTLQGTGNYAACRVLTDSLMDTSARCLTDPNGDFSAHTTCSVGGTYQPPVNGNFVAFSGFTHVTDFLSLAANASLAQLQQAATASCKTPWTTLQANHPGVPAQYLSGYCGTSVYIGSLLQTGYGFPVDSHAVRVASSAEGISYALGSMIWEANALGWKFDGENTDVENEPWVALFIVFALLFVIAVGIACLFASKIRSLTSYNPRTSSTGHVLMRGV